MHALSTYDIVHVVAGIDYVPINQVVQFAPGVLEQTLQVTILDDLGQPKLEGDEKFQLVLRLPKGGNLGQPSKAIITINDSFSDCKSSHRKYICSNK